MVQYELFKSIYNSTLKSRAVNVMSCLITYMNNRDNTCFPAIKTIAKCCSMGVSTVKRALNDLVDAGFVEKVPRFIEAKNMAQTSNLYRLSAVFTELEPPKEKESADKKECETFTFETIPSSATEEQCAISEKTDYVAPKHSYAVPAISAISKIGQLVMDRNIYKQPPPILIPP